MKLGLLCITKLSESFLRIIYVGLNFMLGVYPLFFIVFMDTFCKQVIN